MQQLQSFALLVSLAIVVTLAGCVQRAAHPRLPAAEPARPQPVATTVSTAAPSIGKELFMARCGSCHDERGDKPLPSGPPLNQRKLSRHVIAEAVNDRLKNRTEAEREAVIEYISGLYVGPK